MTISSTPNNLSFSFAEMEQEAISMSTIASKYLDDEHDDMRAIFGAWIGQLQNFRRSPPGAKLDWKISRERPIRTKVSSGEYEPDDKGKYHVYATLSAVWQIAIPSFSGSCTARRGSSQSQFELVGKASTRVSVLECCTAGDPKELARWRFEVGNLDSPGCHFHAQILGEDSDTVFPKSMSVPRLPNMLFTPMDALEFTLGELFQDDWPRHVAKETDPIRNWAGCQKGRLTKLLKWQQEHLDKSSGSPWTSLKAAKPHANLLVRTS